MLPSKSNTYASSEKSRLVVPLFLNLVQARGSPFQIDFMTKNSPG